MWFRFVTRFVETSAERRYLSTTLWITTGQHDPLTATWVQDRLDHPALGRPSGVNRQGPPKQPHLSLGIAPLTTVKSHALIGPGGRSPHGVSEYISCRNPYYRPRNAGRRQQYEDLRTAGIPLDRMPALVDLDRLPLRIEGGSADITDDYFVESDLSLTRFGPRHVSDVLLLSGTTTPVRKDNYTTREATRQRSRREQLTDFLMG